MSQYLVSLLGVVGAPGEDPLAALADPIVEGVGSAVHVLLLAPAHGWRV